MTKKRHWIGSHGPYFYDDAEQVNDPDGVVTKSQSGMVTEGTVKALGTPTDDADLTNKSYIAQILSTLSVANIDDPSSELNTRAGSAVGSMILAYESLTDTNKATLYYWDDSTSLSENVPYTVDGSSGIWIALAGRYQAIKKLLANALELNNATENLAFSDAGSTGATEQDWIEVTVGGTTGYIRVYSAK